MYSHQNTLLSPHNHTHSFNFSPFHFPSPSSPQTMLDLRRGLASKHLSSFPPVYVPNTWKADFDFWGEPRTKVYDDNGGCSGYADAEVEFQAKKLHDDDDDPCSPRLGTSPLLPSDHEYSYPSPRSRLQTIVDGRRELMEMIQDLPESSYELSLKDIVDENLQAEQKDIVVDEASLNVKPEVKTMLRNNKNRRRGPILRSTSMDSGVFLLKMFLPVSLGLKKKPTGNRATISTRPSLERSEKTGDTEWWRMRFLARRGSKNSVRSSSSGSTSSSRSSSR